MHRQEQLHARNFKGLLLLRKPDVKKKHECADETFQSLLIYAQWCERKVHVCWEQDYLSWSSWKDLCKCRWWGGKKQTRLSLQASNKKQYMKSAQRVFNIDISLVRAHDDLRVSDTHMHRAILGVCVWVCMRLRGMSLGGGLFVWTHAESCPAWPLHAASFFSILPSLNCGTPWLWASCDAWMPRTPVLSWDGSTYCCDDGVDILVST